LRLLTISVKIFHVKFLLALALTIHLTGLPMAAGQWCVGGGPMSEHACCCGHNAQAAEHVGSPCQCGCQVGPSDERPVPSSAAVTLQSDGTTSEQAVESTDAPRAVDAGVSLHRSFDRHLPLDSPARLTGAGFRC